MGLVAAVMSRWPSSKYYSYGYGRVEVLSGNDLEYLLMQKACAAVYDSFTFCLRSC